MDKFNTKEEVTQFLMDRYGLGRSTILNRLKYLEMKVQSEDGQFFLDIDQLGELDQLNEWIQSGQKLVDFPKQGQLVKQESSELAIPSIDLEPVEGNTDTALAQLLRTAQEQAAGITIAKNLLTAEFLKNPSQLPEDLREQVERSQGAMAPKSRNPLEIAGEWMRKTKLAA
ncbi:hypothetical protein [Synechocystis sp. LKSZ1]|uniref:hypothetical protein n=1 Tax=Synechocystis sp. LKSZ1 TaxID=3144951 RepID=UPI00336BCFE0